MNRYRRHQLALELTAVAVLIALTKRPDMVGLPAAVLLPGIRSTWVDAVRAGPGLAPTAVGAVFAGAAWGVGGATLVVALASGIGVVRRRLAPSPT